MAKHPNHKPKSNKFITANRVKQVQVWVMEDLSRGDIMEKILKKYPIALRQAERYYQKAYDLFEEYNQMHIEKKKAYYIQRKRKLIQDMDPKLKNTPAGARVINNILDSMAEIEGIKKQNIEINGSVAMTHEVDYSKLSDAALEEIAAARQSPSDGGTD